MNRLTGLVAALGALVAATVAWASPASAADATPWGAVLLWQECGSSAKASVAADGTARLFGSCHPEVTQNPPIFYMYHRLGEGDAIRGGTSPYHGTVLATAWDGVSVAFVLYREGTAVKIGGRVGDTGAWVAPATLSSNGLADGDLVASNGKWRAVWAERVGTNTDVYQAHTLLGTATRHRVTVAANWDAEPSLSLAGGRLMLAWTRSASTTSAAGPSHIYLATSTGGAWAGGRYTGVGTTNTHPSLATGHQDKVVWNRDGHALIGRISGGVEHDFGSSTRAELAQSGTTAMVAWEVIGPGPTPGAIDADVKFASSSTGTWGPTQPITTDSAAPSLMFLLGRGGKGQVGYYYQAPDFFGGAPSAWLTLEP